MYNHKQEILYKAFINLDKENLKKFEKLPPDVKRQLALYMNNWNEKKKDSQYPK